MEAEKDGMTSVWWGTFTLPEERMGCWEVGPSRLYLYNGLREWRLYHHQYSDPMEETVRVIVPVEAEIQDAMLDGSMSGYALQRFSFEQPDSMLRVSPAMPDRAMIVRPEDPFYILPGEAVTMYVSLPVWIRLEAGRAHRLLCEVPSYRPSDTWFGPNTREGSLCYATRTRGETADSRLAPTVAPGNGTYPPAQ